MKEFKMTEERKLQLYAVCSAFIVGLLANASGLTQVLYNHDNLAMQPNGFGFGITSGRWFLEILGRMMNWATGGYNVPFFNGIVFLALIALSAGLIVSVLGIRRRVSAAVIGGLFVLFPTVTSTMFYRFTTIYYGIAVYFSVLAAWVLIHKKFGFLYCAALTALALGIYQAYVPLTASLLVLYFLRKCLTEKVTWKEVLLQGLYDCGSLLVGVLLYFFLLQICLSLMHAGLSDYQGVNDAGKLSLMQLAALIPQTFRSFLFFPVENMYSLAPIWLLKFGCQAMVILAIVLAVWAVLSEKRPASLNAVIVLLLLAFPVAANFILIMCPNAIINAIMVYALVTVLMAPLVFLECCTFPGEEIAKLCRRVVLFFAALVMVGYAYFADVNYTAMYVTNRQMETYFNSLTTQIRMVEGYSPELPVAVIGNVSDSLLDSVWDTVPRYTGNAATWVMVNVYSRDNWVSVVQGLHFPRVDEERLEILRQSEAVQKMPCWPAQGSIAIQDHTVVVKLGE